MKTFSLDAERAVVGAVMLTGEKAFHQVSQIICANDFFDETSRIIFTAAEKAIDGKMPIDPISISELLSKDEIDIVGGMHGISELCRTPSSSNSSAYARIVLDQSNLRRLVNTGSKIIALGGDDDSTQEKIAKAQELVNDLTKTQKTDDKDSYQAAHELVEWMKRTDSDTKSGFFDEHTGGLFSGLIVVAAGTGQGKSTLALNIAYNLRNSSVAYYSLEMPAAQLMGRMASNHSNINFKKIRDKDMNEGEWVIFADTVKTIRESKIRFIDNGIHINQLCAHARAMKNNSGLDLVIVDYIQLVGSDGQTREREVANITRKLKGLSMDLDVPVIALSQLSRDHEKRANPRPCLRDLRESGAVEQDSDLVLFLYDEAKVRDDPNNPNYGLTELYSGKFRHGENFSVALDQQLENYRFVRSERGVISQKEGVRL
jgi:replicative DNA helicase